MKIPFPHFIVACIKQHNKAFIVTHKSGIQSLNKHRQLQCFYPTIMAKNKFVFL